VNITKKIRLACFALVIDFISTAVPAGAQSLALSYDLDVRKDTVERVSLPTYHCTGSDWLNSIASCARDGGAAESGAESPLRIRRVTVGASGDATAAIPHHALQAGEDALNARRRTADVSLRFGSKNRLSSDETRDVPRSVDAPYESYLHSNAHKAIGLELLVPFQ
jgi:hypothetical protein